MLSFRGQAYQQQNWSLEQKLLYDMELLSEVKQMYDLVNYLFLICIRKGLRLIMENPYSEEHFLRRYWCYPPAIIDKDRRKNGDFFKKPTQYWFLNCEPSDNFIINSIPDNRINCKDAIRFMTAEDYLKTGAKNKKVARSMIHRDYAERFIKQYILDVEGGILI